MLHRYLGTEYSSALSLSERHQIHTEIYSSIWHAKTKSLAKFQAFVLADTQTDKDKIVHLNPLSKTEYKNDRMHFFYLSFTN